VSRQRQLIASRLSNRLVGFLYDHATTKLCVHVNAMLCRYGLAGRAVAALIVECPAAQMHRALRRMTHLKLGTSHAENVSQHQDERRDDIDTTSPVVQISRSVQSQTAC
jgi:hypothetical protein